MSGGEPSPGADVEEVRKLPVQRWKSECRRGRGSPSVTKVVGVGPAYCSFRQCSAEQLQLPWLRLCHAIQADLARDPIRCVLLPAACASATPPSLMPLSTAMKLRVTGASPCRGSPNVASSAASLQTPQNRTRLSARHFCGEAHPHGQRPCGPVSRQNGLPARLGRRGSAACAIRSPPSG